MPSVPLHFIDDHSGGYGLNLLQKLDNTASYTTIGYTEQLTANYKQNIDGTEFDAVIKGSPIDFGRMPNYQEKKQAVTQAKGYIFPFQHEHPWYPIKKLEDFDTYASMPSTMRGEKHTKEMYPFLIIGFLGHTGTEKFTPKQVAEWANKHFETWEYITIDLWSIMSSADRQALLKSLESQRAYENKQSAEPKELEPLEDRLSKLSEEEVKQIEEEQIRKLQEAMNKLTVKADKIVLPEVKEEVKESNTTSKDKFSFSFKRKTKKTTPPKAQNSEEKRASSFSKFLQSVLLLRS